MSSTPQAIFLMGPTASGKTALAIRLIKQFPCEIISVDSAMVYRGLNIGSAKPSAEELAEAPHRLIDICDPQDVYSAARFREDALREMEEIVGRGKVPLLVGGTMLYFRTLQYGLADMPDADLDIRANIVAEAEVYGWQAVHDRLASIDPASAARIKPSDPQRLQRALEVYELTGKTLTEIHESSNPDPLPWDILKLAITPDDRAVLHQRIEKRFEQMLANGFIQEVERLRSSPEIHQDLPAIKSVGYRQAWAHLDGEIDQEEMLRQGVVATRRLAKRQLTWLRSEKDVVWLDSESTDLVDKASSQVGRVISVA